MAMRRAFLWSFKNLGKIILVYLPTIILALVGLGVVLHVFVDIKVDTTNLTNIGFAILVGLSSVTFSWARAIDPDKEPGVAKVINRAGEKLLQAALIFLLSSAIKYIVIHIEVLPFKTESPRLYNFIHGLLSWCYSFAFAIGYVITLLAVTFLNNTLYERNRL